MAASPASPRTILAVDDSEGHLKVLELALGAHRYQVETARDGHEALTLLQSLTPDLMIVDVEMPFMDGLELAKRVRRLRRFANMPILIMTSTERDDMDARVREAGADQVIYKPVQGKSLDRVVGGLLRRRQHPHEDGAFGA